MRVVIVGGGIAGISTARALAPRVREVTLLESEPQLCAHSSGRNAAIFCLLESYSAAIELARLSAGILDGMFPEGRVGWLDACGMLVTAATPDPLLPLAALADGHGLRALWRDGSELVRAVSHAPGLQSMVGVFLPDAGVLDIHRITSELALTARARGAETRVGVKVKRILVRCGAVSGVELESGQQLAADVVVLAAGAWSAGLGAGSGAALPLQAYRRHLMQLEMAGPPLSGPIVWHVKPEVYFRRESAGILASPCDRDAVDPGKLVTDDAALCELGLRLAPFGPRLANARLRTLWACARCISPDGRAVIGADPRISGLFWLSALAGHGMSTGVAAGEWLSRLVFQEEVPLAGEVAPSRYLNEGSMRVDLIDS